jgi:monofunctional biosynthetic peptidoglycan transglycosylase
MVLRSVLKITTFLVSFLLVILLSGVMWLGIVSRSLPDVRFLSDSTVSFQITVKDWQGNEKPFTVGPENPFWTPLVNIPTHLRNAVLAGEDFSFYSHNGVDWFEVRESFFRNLELGRFARGASTITQQLAKNLFLTREKTVSRKLRELILARRLEKALSKDRILELYLNVVELGDMVYGAGLGSKYHFGKDPAELTLRESALLAAMLPGPGVYDPGRHLERLVNRSDHLLGVMLKGRMIGDEEYLAALRELPFAPEAPSSADPAPIPPPEGDTDISVIGTATKTRVESPHGESEPVPVPIPGY